MLRDYLTRYVVEVHYREMRCSKHSTLFVLSCPLVLFVAFPVQACIMDAMLPRREGETDAELRKRFEMEQAARKEAFRVEVEQKAIAMAERIYFARIVQMEIIGVGPGIEGGKATLEPLRAVKGGLPSEAVVLSDHIWTSCGPVGDGEAPRGQVGEVYAVFDNVDIFGNAWRDGIAKYSIALHNLRDLWLKSKWDSTGESARTKAAPVGQ